MTSSILIVDSDPSAHLNYNVLLLDTTLQIEIVPSEEEARQRLATQQIDIVITDLETLGSTGLSFLAYTRSLQTIPDLIFVTTETTLDTAIEGLKSGARHYLFKPCPPEQLFQSGFGGDEDEVGNSLQAAGVGKKRKSGRTKCL